MGCRTPDFPPLSFPSSQAAGDTAYQPPIDPRLRVRGRGGRTTDATMVSPSEGNEARRNGWQGVAAPQSTVEAGEPTRGTPSREGVPSHEPLKRNLAGTS